MKPSTSRVAVAALVAMSVIPTIATVANASTVPQRGQTWAAGQSWAAKGQTWASIPERGQSWVVLPEANKWSTLPETTTTPCAAANAPFWCGVPRRGLASWLRGLSFFTPGESAMQQSLIGVTPIAGYRTPPRPAV